MVISREVFENTMRDFRMQGPDCDNARAALERYGVTIAENVSVIMPEKLSEINQSYSAQYAMEKIGITPQISPIISLPGDTPINRDNQIDLTSVQA